MLPPARLGVVFGPFLGAVVDASDRKRLLISTALVGTAATYVLLVTCQTTWVVAVILSVQGAFAALYPPAINSVSIGLVGPLKVSCSTFRKNTASPVHSAQPCTRDSDRDNLAFASSRRWSSDEPRAFVQHKLRP